jgi:hypothetical protein
VDRYLALVERRRASSGDAHVDLRRGTFGGLCGPEPFVFANRFQMMPVK